jgi:hypothetical protein
MSERKIIHIGYRPRDQFRAFHKRSSVGPHWSAIGVLARQSRR